MPTTPPKPQTPVTLPQDPETLNRWVDWAENLPRPQEDRLINASIRFLAPKVGLLRTATQTAPLHELLNFLTSPILTHTHLNPIVTDKSGFALSDDELRTELALYLEHALRFFALECFTKAATRNLLPIDIPLGVLKGVGRNLHAWWDTDRAAAIFAKIARTQKEGALKDQLSTTYRTYLTSPNPWHQRMGVVGLMMLGDSAPAKSTETLLIPQVLTAARHHYYLSMSLGWSLTTFWQQDPRGVEAVLLTKLTDTDAGVVRRFRQKVRESRRTLAQEGRQLEAVLSPWLG